MTSQVPYVCSKCHGQLQQGDHDAVCTQCNAQFQREECGCVDFAGPSVSFDEWWLESDEKKQQWLTKDAPQEEEYEVGLARNYVHPLIESLGFRPGNCSVLSAGCGLGSDVDLLNELGYPTWGLDIGSRVLAWATRNHVERLCRADIREMPFPDNSFDFVLSLNTIEHIGTVGDSNRVTPDYLEQRKLAMQSLLRVTKPGGYLLLSGLSRTIPFDFGHIQEVKFVRIHSPWEKFLLNFNDIRRMCNETGQVQWTRPLPLRGFFSWTRLRHNRIARPLLPMVDWLFGSLPNWVYGSWACPFWIALARRQPNDAGLATKAFASNEKEIHIETSK